RGGRQLGGEDRVGKRGGQHFQYLVAGRQRAGNGGGGGGERGHAGNYLDRRVGGNAGDQVHGGAVEQGIALAEPGDVAAAFEAGKDGDGGAVIGGLRRGALHGHGNA